MLAMRLEGLAKYPNDFEPPVVVLRAVDGDRRLSLGVCEHHAQVAADLIRSGGATSAPSCRAARSSRPYRVVEAHITWLEDGPLGPQVEFTLLFERQGETVEEPSCLFGMLKSVLRHGVEVRVDERILDQLRPSEGEPHWLAGPLEQAPSEPPSSPLRQFIEGLDSLDRL